MRKSGFTLVELMIVVAIIGILAAIAIPNFMKFQARSKQTEPKSNLRALFVAQRVLFSEEDTYSMSVPEIGFVPDRGNRYFLVVGCATLSQRNAAAENINATHCGFTADTYKGFGSVTTASLVNLTAAAASATTGVCAPVADVGCVTLGNNGAFLGLAASNIDNDATLDTWAVSSMSLSVAANATVGAEAEANFGAPGSPVNNINDAR